MNIDVVIPAYNAASYIEIALRSVLDQTLLPQKVIVINDGSTDSTADIVVRFATGEHAQRVVLINQPNKGLPAARNAGIRASSADSVAFLDADDIWLPNKLERQAQCFLGSSEETGVVYCGFRVVDVHGHPIENRGFVFDESIRGHVYEKLRFGNFVAGSGSGVLVKRRCFDQVGMFDEGLPYAEDWDMWLRLARKFDYDYVRDELVLIRRHGQSMQADPLRALIGQMMFLERRFKDGALVWEQLKEFRLALHKSKLSALNLAGQARCAPEFMEQLSWIRVEREWLAHIGSRLLNALIHPRIILSKIREIVSRILAHYGLRRRHV